MNINLTSLADTTKRLLTGPVWHLGLDAFIVNNARLTRKARFFERGFGEPHVYRTLRRLQNDENAVRKEMLSVLPLIDWKKSNDWLFRSGIQVWEGKFGSPAAPLLPASSAMAEFMLVLPQSAAIDVAKNKHASMHNDANGGGVPVVFLLPPTSDFTSEFRLQLLGIPLAKRGIASVIPTVPFYASRKPKDQYRASLRNVSDLMTLGAGCTSEASALCNYLDERGFGPFGTAGISMGGFMAASIACHSERDMACCPIVLPANVHQVFTTGLLSSMVDFTKGLNRDAHDADYRRRLLHAIGIEESDFQLSRESFAIDDRTFDEDTLLASVLKAAVHPASKRAPRPRSPELIETIHFFANILNEMTDLAKFPMPRRPDAIVQVLARHDAYLCQEDGERMMQHWPESQRVLLEAGHVSTLFHQPTLVNSVLKSLDLVSKPKK